MDKQSGLRKNIPIPLYFQLEIILKEKIESNNWHKNFIIPSERQICEDFGISRVTVRKALKRLEDEGLLKKVNRRGTIVSSGKSSNRLLDQELSFYHYLKDKGFKVENKIIEYTKIKSTSFLKKVFKLNKNEKIFKIKRVRIVDSVPWYFGIMYYPSSIFPNLKKNDFKIGSFSRLIQEKYSIEIEKTRRKLYPHLASKDESELLDINIGDPLQVIEVLNFYKNNVPFEYSINYFRPNKVSLEVVIDKEENKIRLKESKE